VALRGNFSGLVSATDLVKNLKRCDKSSSLHLKKIFCLGNADFFVSDVISGGLLGHPGPLSLALGANC